MFKKLLIGAAILYLYRFITKPWKDTTLYQVGLIDKDGNLLKENPAKMNSDQKKAYNKLTILGYKIRKLLELYPLLKFQFAKALIGIMLMKESTEQTFRIVQHNGMVGLIKEDQDYIKSKMNLVTVYLENGEIVYVDKDTLFEDDVTIDASLNTGSNVISNSTDNIIAQPMTAVLVTRNTTKRTRKFKARHDD